MIKAVDGKDAAFGDIAVPGEAVGAGIPDENRIGETSNVWSGDGEPPLLWSPPPMMPPIKGMKLSPDVRK